MQNTDHRPKFIAKAMCLVFSNDCVLAYQGKIGKAHNFWRLPGGHIEFGETSVAAVEREMLEETGEIIKDAKLEKVLENIFEVESQKFHEFVFIYSAKFANANAYLKTNMHILDKKENMPLQWVKISDILSGTVKIVPEAVVGICKNHLN